MHVRSIQTADIIAFPRRAAAPRPAPAANTGTDQGRARLEQALAGLEAALDQQREAVAGWRTAMAELQGSVGQLGGSLKQFQGRLAGVQIEVECVNADARRLEGWADDALDSAG